MVPALQNTALNVVCNQEYAQAVPHVWNGPSPFHASALTLREGSLPHYPRAQVEIPKPGRRPSKGGPCRQASDAEGNAQVGV